MLTDQHIRKALATTSNSTTDRYMTSTPPLASRIVEGPSGPVTVRLSHPVEDDGDYYCLVEITGQGSRDVHLKGYGVDELQALESAMTIIRANLDNLD